MNDLNTLASLVLSGAGEELYTIDVTETTVETPAPAPAPVAPREPRTQKRRTAVVSTVAVATYFFASQASAGGMVPSELAVFVWAPLLGLTFGCLVALVGSIALPRLNWRAIGSRTRPARDASTPGYAVPHRA